MSLAQGAEDPLSGFDNLQFIGMCALYQLLAGGSVMAEAERRLDLGFMRPGGGQVY